MVNVVAKQLAGEAVVGFVNVDEQPDLVKKFGVLGIPAFFLVSGETVLDSWTGVLTPGQIAKRVREALPVATAGLY